ncbi:MAG TPA: BON domain-containing protein [Gemmatimonadaceae bacterium]|jgi:osmotically-inducible protein OsmY
MTTSSQLHKNVLQELAWEPSVTASNLAIETTDGVVTMRGHVGSVREHDDALAAVQRIAGVRAVADEVEVRLPEAAQRPDPALAVAVAGALEWNAAVPRDRIKATVKDGWVTLRGEVDWYYEKAAALRVVRQLVGVKGVVDEITIAPRASPGEVVKQIEAALARYAEEEAHHIRVSADGSHVTLQGWVHSWPEYQRVEQAAWAAPGVDRVTNLVTVSPRQ